MEGLGTILRLCFYPVTPVLLSKHLKFPDLYWDFLTENLNFVEEAEHDTDFLTWA